MGQCMVKGDENIEVCSKNKQFHAILLTCAQPLNLGEEIRLRL